MRLSSDTDSNLSSLILDSEHQYHSVSLFLLYEYSSDVLDEGPEVVVRIVRDGRTLFRWNLMSFIVQILVVVQRIKGGFELHDRTCLFKNGIESRSYL